MLSSDLKGDEQHKNKEFKFLGSRNKNFWACSTFENLSQKDTFLFFEKYYSSGFFFFCGTILEVMCQRIFYTNTQNVKNAFLIAPFTECVIHLRINERPHTLQLQLRWHEIACNRGSVCEEF